LPHSLRQAGNLNRAALCQPAALWDYSSDDSVPQMVLLRSD
jgi:hypothetical protein